MTHRGTVRTALKRGALLTAANWQVVVIQSVADSIVKVLIAIPVLGGTFMAALVAENGLSSPLSGDLRQAAASAITALSARPVALAAFAVALGVVVLGGSILMFLVKGGTTTILVAADASAGPLERPPLRLAYFQRSIAFTVEGYTLGARRLFPRYLVLGLWLTLIYVLSIGSYVAALVTSYPFATGPAPFAGWTVLAAVLLLVLTAWMMLVDLVYLLAQIVVAVTPKRPMAAIREALAFLHAERRRVARAFGVVLLLVVLATGLSLVAFAGLGLIAFVPVAGLAVLPVQLGAAFLRSLLFQYLGLTALCAYLTLYRSWAGGPGAPAGEPRHSFIEESSS